MVRKSGRLTFFQETNAPGNKISAATKKRQNAKVNGGILVRASLNIGAAAPQIILVMINAKTE